MINHYNDETNHSYRRIPSKFGGIIAGLSFSIFGIICTVIMIDKPVPETMKFIGPVFIVIGIIAAIFQFDRANKYEAAENDYQRRRREHLTGKTTRPVDDQFNPFD
jgi:hypothetical protein